MQLQRFQFLLIFPSVMLLKTSDKCYKFTVSYNLGLSLLPTKSSGDLSIFVMFEDSFLRTKVFSVCKLFLV